ncbi:RluA family pseudouridine synthase [Caenimonas aquaedulcis]|uniref:Dual-specificity RNA pseudouridine synthase RluA n=1 Tax=Caenimonas aquaedulcis TaxID=2793270 RepID=A0A931H8L0_9BURK|nr:RluA family pseudouridine synthase [Caenimonas aquaedulcis]MBG9390338.1 RluA family pseudouridine synthase [Caenimonas aquaedulcis]
MVEPLLRVLHEDAHLLAFDKPAGLLSVPGRGPGKQDCLSARAQAAFPGALVVHRLDMATSGLFLMARGAAMQRALSHAFAQGQVDKRYEAVVAGDLRQPAQTADGWALIDLPIAADWPRRPLRIVDAAAGKPSRTRWRVLEAAAGTTRLELAPLTGRTHQLRVHLQAVGHPILGDALYAPPEVQSLAPRLLLHATSLQFTHPDTGSRVALSCSPAF